MVKKIVFYFLMFNLSGCAFYSRLQGAYIDVAGTWKYKDLQNTAPVTMTLYDDYTYELDTDGDADKDIWGRYKIFRNQITFKDDEKSNSADICFEPGIYYYSVSQRNAHFQLLADQCRYRASALSYEWTKVKPEKLIKDRAYKYSCGCE